MTAARSRIGLLALIAAVVLASSPVLSSSPAGAAPTGGTEPELEEHLRVVAQTAQVAPSGTFTIDVAVDDAPPGASLRLSVHNRVLTRSAFNRSLEFTGLGSRLNRQVRPLAGLAPVAGDAFRLQVTTVVGGPADEFVSLPRGGVYPVVVELLDDDSAVVDRFVTHLVALDALDEDVNALAVVVVVPLHAPPAHRAVDEVVLEPAAIDRLTAAVTALTAHPELAVTLAPTPETIDALVEDRNLAPLVAGVDEGRTVLASTYVPIDVRAWVAADLADPLDEQLEAGAATLTRHLNGLPDTSIWRADAEIDQPTLAALVDRDVGRVVLPAAALEPVDSGDFPLTLTRPFRVALGEDEGDGFLEALAADQALTGHVGSLDDPVLEAHRVIADLAVLANDEPANRRVAVLALPDGETPNAAFLGALLAGLEPVQPTAAAAPPPVDPVQPPPVVPTPPAPAPLLEVVDLATAFDQVEPAGADGGAASTGDRAEDSLVRELSDRDRPAGLTSFAERFAITTADIQSFRSAFGPADPVAASLDDLVLVAGSIELTAAERNALFDTVRSTILDNLAGVAAPDRQRVTLTAREGRVQLVLANDTGRQIDVLVELRGDRLEFPDIEEGRLPVRVTGSTTRVEVDVRARASGDSSMDVRITTPDGRIVLDETRFTVRTTAVSGVGIVLMAAAGLFLVVWWSRTILRERRAGVGRRRPAHAIGGRR